LRHGLQVLVGDFLHGFLGSAKAGVGKEASGLCHGLHAPARRADGFDGLGDGGAFGRAQPRQRDDGIAALVLFGGILGFADALVLLSVNP